MNDKIRRLIIKKIIIRENFKLEEHLYNELNDELRKRRYSIEMRMLDNWDRLRGIRGGVLI